MAEASQGRAVHIIQLALTIRLTLATCAEVEGGKADVNRNNADHYSAAEGERAVQEDFGEPTADVAQLPLTDPTVATLKHPPAAACLSLAPRLVAVAGIC